MTDIVWEDPPVSGNHPHGKHAAIAAELRRNPGKWAKVAVAASAYLRTDIKRARFAAYEPAGSFDAVSRNHRQIDGRKSQVADIYARYVGNGQVDA